MLKTIEMNVSIFNKKKVFLEKNVTLKLKNLILNCDLNLAEANNTNKIIK